MSENTKQQWIYNVIISHIDADLASHELEDYYTSELRQRGEYGWELVSVTMLRPDTVGFFLKKLITASTEGTK